MMAGKFAPATEMDTGPSLMPQPYEWMARPGALSKSKSLKSKVKTPCANLLALSY